MFHKFSSYQQSSNDRVTHGIHNTSHLHSVSPLIYRLDVADAVCLAESVAVHVYCLSWLALLARCIVSTPRSAVESGTYIHKYKGLNMSDDS